MLSPHPPFLHSWSKIEFPSQVIPAYPPPKNRIFSNGDILRHRRQSLLKVELPPSAVVVHALHPYTVSKAFFVGQKHIFFFVFFKFAKSQFSAISNTTKYQFLLFQKWFYNYRKDRIVGFEKYIHFFLALGHNSVVKNNKNQQQNNNPPRASHKKMLPCSFCGKCFDRPSLLNRHLRTHTGERPHVCDICEKGFSTSSSLNTHRRIHSGEKPHECTICGKRFTASSNLYYHRMTHVKVNVFIEILLPAGTSII